MMKRRMRRRKQPRRRIRRRITPTRTYRLRTRYPPLLRMKRKFILGTWAPNSVTTDGFWRYYNLALSIMPGYTTYTGVFDEYKISRIKLEFVPRWDNFAGNDQSTTTTAWSGTCLHVVRDNHSTVNPSGVYGATSMNAFMAQGPCKTYMGLRTVSIYMTPAVIEDVNGQSRTNRRPPWIRTDFPDTAHRMCHVYAHDANFLGIFGQSFDIYATYYVAFKNMK